MMFKGIFGHFGADFDDFGRKLKKHVSTTTTTYSPLTPFRFKIRVKHQKIMLFRRSYYIGYHKMYVSINFRPKMVNLGGDILKTPYT